MDRKLQKIWKVLLIWSFTNGKALELDLQPRWVQVRSYIKCGNCYDALGQRKRAEYKKAIEVGRLFLI